MKTVLTASFTVLCLIAQSVWAATSDYDQPYRPQYHFSPQKNWTNDPNGLVFFEGEYHLFYQYNPQGIQWGHMSWGHAVTRDLLHWQELPVAIPEGPDGLIFTGSTVVDKTNSSGFCKGREACLVAIYTRHFEDPKTKSVTQTQSLAFSNDKGRTWTKYSGNPVVDLHMSDFRDPKVFWSEAKKHWVMVVALPNDHKVLLYGSRDLKHWDRMSEFGPAGATGGQWECPELFELPVPGKTSETKWVMKVGLNPGALWGGSGEQYFIGNFDGQKFTNDNPSKTTLWTDYGKDCYCALTFNNLPQNRPPVMLGWMDNWQYAAKLPTSPWHGQMTIPRSLSLRNTEAGIRLFQQPIPLRGGEQTSKAQQSTSKSHSFVLDAEVDLGSAKSAGWRIMSDRNHFTTVGYDSQTKKLFVDRTKSGLVDFSPEFPGRFEAPLDLNGKPLTLKILADQLSVEVFAQGGRIASTNLVFPPAAAHEIQFFSEGKAGHHSSAVTDLESTH